MSFPAATAIDPTISPAQLQANRENARKSTGPQSAEGKQRSRINATRHGLTGQFQALSPEDKVAFDRHCLLLAEDLQPSGYRENLLARSIAEDQWRLNRSRAIENNIFALGVSGPLGEATLADTPEVHMAACQARVWLEDAHNLQLLALYETRIRRNLEKNERQFAALREARLAAEKQALQEAKTLARLARATPSAPQPPASHGFVFSNEQIERSILLEDGLARAAQLARHGWQTLPPSQKAGLRVRKAA